VTVIIRRIDDQGALIPEHTRVQSFTYDAFISYRHVERDQKWAAWL